MVLKGKEIDKEEGVAQEKEEEDNSKVVSVTINSHTTTKEDTIKLTSISHTTNLTISHIINLDTINLNNMDNLITNHTTTIKIINKVDSSEISKINFKMRKINFNGIFKISSDDRCYSMIKYKKILFYNLLITIYKNLLFYLFFIF